jgi:outer membrane protein OmpA-like peptidoglycan-associated protein
MKKVLIFMLCAATLQQSSAQLLRKLKDKVNNAVNKTVDKATDKTVNGSPDKKNGDDKNGTNSNGKESGDTNETNKGANNSTGTSSLKVYSKFDFVPGKTILYFDNFEKDNIGETPLGWITSKSAEVVNIEGLEGNWAKLANNFSSHICRSKKQSWGNSFTVEFDLLFNATDQDASTYSYINLFNSNGKLVTDENLISDVGDNMKNATSFFYRFDLRPKYAENGHSFNVYKNGTEAGRSSGEKVPYTENKPMHFSFCIQGKRYRVWLDNKKLFDLNAANENAPPNQLGFYMRGQADYYISNIRIAKDIPDTRAEFNEGKIISNLLFYTGTANLKPESMGSLLDVSKVIKDATEKVKIVGHTDSDGEDAANLRLSQQRAEAVKTILIKEYGIEESKLTTEGRGETQPIADNKSAEGKAQNRRVEFIFKAEADKYQKPAGMGTAGSPVQNAKADNEKTASSKAVDATPGSIKLSSKLLNTVLSFAQIAKGEKGIFSLTASKEEGNSKENFFKIDFKPVTEKVKPETYYFGVQNMNNPASKIKQLPEIVGSSAALYYNTAKKPYVKEFVATIADGHACKVKRSVSDECKLVIEKVENGLASGYFIFGTHLEGMQPIKCLDGEGSNLAITDGYGGQIKGIFTNVPVY